MKRDKSFAGNGAYGALFLLTVFFMWLFCLRRGLFGAKVDWVSQHSVLPDYFRRQFYETGNLFPEFAANIGGGQNIYNFSYYGLLSPVILPSYLLPFVKMSDYMMAVQFVCLAVSVLLLFRWLSGRGFEKKICFGVSVIFLLSGPMIYHSYNQIMFVDYMPFLCMGFLGVDRYFAGERKGAGRYFAGGRKDAEAAGKEGIVKGIRRRRGGLLAVSVFLMIMTSFYFSIGGMLALVLYGLHRYVKEREGVFTSLILFFVPFFTAVLMSGVLLIPTAMAMAGREGGSKVIALGELFLPEFSPGRFFYTPYGMGLTVLAFVSLAAMAFCRGWAERVLAWGCIGVLFLPVFAWLLNGGLYVRDKVMIPFLPLMCYVTALYLDGMSAGRMCCGRDACGQEESRNGGCGEKGRRRTDILRGMIPYAAALGFLWFYFARCGVEKYGRFVLADSVLLLISYGIYCVRKNVLVLMLPSVLLLGIFGNGYHGEAANYLDREFYGKVTDVSAERLAERAAESEEGFYRTEQSGTEEENAANLNRIRDMGQYVSSIYSSLYNGEYQRFRETFGTGEPYRNFLMQPGSENPVYRRFMGVKYLIADRDSQEAVAGHASADKEHSSGGSMDGAPCGYALKDEEGELGLYEDCLVSPVAYATDKLMGEEEYRVLTFPENQLALLKAAVVEEMDGNARKTSGGGELVPAEVSLPGEIDSRKAEAVRVDIRQLAENLDRQPGGKANAAENTEESSNPDRVLFLRFQVENFKPSRDVAVWAEGQRNKLTSKKHFYYNGNTAFTYGIPLQKGQRSIEMVFGKGHYKISDVQCFLGALPAKEEAESLYQSEFLPDKERTKGNVLAGDIDVKHNGYFITTIPFDENFEISVDGESVKTERVNTAFLGCRIEEGRHEVEIVFHAPGMTAGKIVSVLGMVLFMGVNFGRRERKEETTES